VGAGEGGEEGEEEEEEEREEKPALVWPWHYCC